MSLFAEQVVTEVVTPTDIKNITGISASDFDFPNESEPEKALDELLKAWIQQIASHIHTRIKREVASDDIDYHAIRDVLIRTVAKLVSVAMQQRTSPVVQINDFAVSILNTSEVTSNLGRELRPFRKKGLSVISSSDEYIEEDTTT